MRALVRDCAPIGDVETIRDCPLGLIEGQPLLKRENVFFLRYMEPCRQEEKLEVIHLESQSPSLWGWP
jgi:hypothetical protein